MAPGFAGVIRPSCFEPHSVPLQGRLAVVEIRLDFVTERPALDCFVGPAFAGPPRNDGVARLLFEGFVPDYVGIGAGGFFGDYRGGFGG
jgi:hypothetical protein